MKLSRIGRIFILGIAGTAVLFCLATLLGPLFDSSLQFGSDYLYYNIVIIFIFLFPALYLILYKKPWVIVPAKIILLFAAVGLTGLAFFEYNIYEDIFTTIVLTSLLATSLLHVYRKNIQLWLSSLKKKPFFDYKKLPTLSNKNIALLAICLQVVLTFFVFSFSYWSALTATLLGITALIIIFIYVLSNSSPAKSIARVIIFIGSTVLLFNAIYIIVHFWLPEYRTLISNNQGIQTSGFTRGLLFYYIVRLSLPVYGFIVLLLTRSKVQNILKK